MAKDFLRGTSAMALGVLLFSASSAGAEILDSTYLDGDAIENYEPVRTYPRWSDIVNKPVTATRWPSFNEITDRPAYYRSRRKTPSFRAGRMSTYILVQLRRETGDFPAG